MTESNGTSVDILTDFGVLGMVVSGGIGTVVIGYFLVSLVLHIIRRQSQSNPIILWWAVACLTLSFLFCIGGLLWRTNVIFLINFASSSFACRLSYCTQYFFYGVSKAALYVLLTYRVEKVFDGTIYAVNSKLYCWLRIAVWIATLGFSGMILGCMPLTAGGTPHLNIYLCFGNVEGMHVV